MLSFYERVCLGGRWGEGEGGAGVVAYTRCPGSHSGHAWDFGQGHYGSSV